METRSAYRTWCRYRRSVNLPFFCIPLHSSFHREHGDPERHNAWPGDGGGGRHGGKGKMGSGWYDETWHRDVRQHPNGRQHLMVKTCKRRESLFTSPCSGVRLKFYGGSVRLGYGPAAMLSVRNVINDGRSMRRQGCQIGPDFPPNLVTLAAAVLQLGLPDWEGNLAQYGNPVRRLVKNYCFFFLLLTSA